MTKHFKATHKKTGDTIEFDLGDITTTNYGETFCLDIDGNDLSFNGKATKEAYCILDLFKDYDLYYNHAGQWFLMGDNK